MPHDPKQCISLECGRAHGRSACWVESQQAEIGILDDGQSALC